MTDAISPAVELWDTETVSDFEEALAIIARQRRTRIDAALKSIRAREGDNDG